MVSRSAVVAFFNPLKEAQESSMYLLCRTTSDPKGNLSLFSFAVTIVASCAAAGLAAHPNHHLLWQKTLKSDSPGGLKRKRFKSH